MASGLAGRIGGRAALIALSVVLALAALEGASRIYLRLDPPTERVDEWVVLAQGPPAYRDADYFSAEFVDEARHCLRRGGMQFSADKLASIGNFEGRYINVRDGRRVTTDVPEHFEHRVIFVGGSTFFSRRVPDALTIPSQVQRMLNARFGGRYGVVNDGFPGSDARRMLRRLRSQPLDPGDIVVFYTGIADVFNPVYLRRFVDEERRQLDGTIQHLNLAQRLMYDLRLRLGARSAAVRVAFGMQYQGLPEAVEDSETLVAIFEKVALDFTETLVASKQIVEDQGAQFYHFLQPTLYIQQNRSANEEWIVQNELKAFPGFDEVFRIGYPKLREGMRNAEPEGVVSFDITDVLDARPEGAEVYFDVAHVNHVANEIIARRMFEAIWGPPVPGESAAVEALGGEALGGSGS